MADKPKLHLVLYAGTVYASNSLPAGCLPRLLALMLTEAVWPLAVGGMVASAIRFARGQIEWRSWIQVLLWLLVPCACVVTRRPAMYDGYRHFLFVLPPVFIGGGLALDACWSRLRRPAVQAAIDALLLLPGLVGIIHLHSYPDAYCNSPAGGVEGAFRRYETDC